MKSVMIMVARASIASFGQEVFGIEGEREYVAWRVSTFLEWWHASVQKSNRNRGSLPFASIISKRNMLVGDSGKGLLDNVGIQYEASSCGVESYVITQAAGGVLRIACKHPRSDRNIL
jgi:hypothetical protein